MSACVVACSPDGTMYVAQSAIDIVGTSLTRKTVHKDLELSSAGARSTRGDSSGRSPWYTAVFRRLTETLAPPVTIVLRSAIDSLSEPRGDRAPSSRWPIAGGSRATQRCRQSRLPGSARPHTCTACRLTMSVLP